MGAPGAFHPLLGSRSQLEPPALCKVVQKSVLELRLAPSSSGVRLCPSHHPSLGWQRGFRAQQDHGAETQRGSLGSGQSWGEAQR